MAQLSLSRSSKLQFPLLQYLNCRSIFKIDIQETDLSKIRLLVIKIASKWPAEESDHHRVRADGEYQALPKGCLVPARSKKQGVYTYSFFFLTSFSCGTIERGTRALFPLGLPFLIFA